MAGIVKVNIGKCKKMSADPTEHNDENSFEYRLKEVSDEEIISILRFREHFQQQAVKAAIKEALKRGLISSIEDLNSEEFQPQPLQTRGLFPLGTTKKHTFAIFRSLCRIYYGFGILPVIYGVVQFTNRKIVQAILAFIIGLIVIFFVNRLEKTVKPFYANLLMALNLPAIGYAIYYLTSLGSPTTMDTVAISIVILVLLYTTFYINKLTSHFNGGKNQE